ncbi:MAG: hypothetical protein KF868_03680 [Acidobacteria bacterium]|nr:hypothetical protein [Acidobacteriota bacterium]MCW5967142.1 hypothetical protein [Blastocatellales bacterium]
MNRSNGGARAGIVLLIAVFCGSAYAQLKINSESQPNGTGGAAFYYVFENERFATPRIEVEFDRQGSGRFRFVRKDGRDIENSLQVSSGLVAQLQALFDEIRFLDVDEDYQYKKDFSHLGKVTITVVQGARRRTASFNYTSNPALNRAVEIFRNIATQETRVFELETVRETDPISTPAQLRLLENELRSKHIAEPRRLISLLNEIKMDESVPLIARNHAERLINMINKAK